MTDRPERARSVRSDDDVVGQFVDGTLRILVELVNSTGLEVGIRLQIGGQIVSGILISGPSHYELLSAQLASGSTNSPTDAARVLSNLYSEIASRLRSDIERRRDDPAASPRETFHIHLRDASAYAPGGNEIELGLWRGKLAGVAGWSLGNYS